MEATRTQPPGEGIARRKFLNGFLGTAVGALAASVVYPVLRYLSPPKMPEAAGNRILAGKASELSSEGWKLFPFGSEPGILIQTGPGQYKAFSATCTHLECTVQFEKSTRRIWCACHNGFYDLDGRNVAGPPPRPLTVFTVQTEGDDIFVTRT